MSKLEEVARQTLAICARGSYLAPSGRTVEIGDALSAAREGTTLHTPEMLAALALARSEDRPRIEVTDETTQQAAQRLAREHDDVALLNFASARNPGGGFLRGAKAQEEDLARCSGLYPCLLRQPRYYEANRAEPSLLYTDHILHAPRVPFFRVRGRDAPLETPFLASVITAPAPNAGQALRHDPSCLEAIGETLDRRARYVVGLAALRGHRALVLGAWGCGVFQNHPERVARAFAQAIAGLDLDRVTFAVPRAVGRNHDAFVRAFGSLTPPR